jgi:phage repressor protein C with HTH and peptisase S24 domain
VPKTQKKRGSKPSDPEFVKRLEGLVKEIGSGRALAELSGVSKNAVHLWLQGSEPGRDKLVKLAAAAGVRLEWLAAGLGPMRADLLPEGYALVRRLSGDGGVEYQGVDYLALKKDWIRSLPGSPAADWLLLTEAIGDAMAPYIRNGDLILINTSDRELRDGVWALSPPIAGLKDAPSGIPTILIRRLRDEGGGNFRLLCDNKDFESPPGQTVRHTKRDDVIGDDLVAVTSNENSIFGILGRIIWKGSEVP